MHALYLKNEKNAIASAALVRAMDAVGDYWKDRYRGMDQNLHILSSWWVTELLSHYEGIVAEDTEDKDEIEEQASELAMADGFLDDDTHFTLFAETLTESRISLPEFPIVRYKGGGFSCSFRP